MKRNEMKKGASPLSSSASPSSSSSSSSGGGGGSSSGSGQGRFTLNVSSSRAQKSDDPAKIFKLIDDNVIGKSAVFLGPYGRRKVVYADYTSSGRSLQFLEDYIIKEVLPAHGDMNCASAVTGLQSQLYYNEVRNLVKSAVNAGSDDEIIFCDGSYASPIERLCFLLCCNESGNGNGNGSGNQSPSREMNNSYGGGAWGSYNERQSFSAGNGPVVFVSTCEIPATLQPWLDAGAQIERVSKNREGYLDLDDLSRKLAKHQSSSRRLIGLFSSASRLTGILADDVATTILLHQYGAISIWDYSHGAPFAPIQTNSPLPGANKDVIFFSASKFVGGVQAPGILVIKKNLLNNLNVATINDSVGVIVTVRAGLVIQLKESLGVQNIMNRLEKICKQMLAHIRTIPEIVLLGPNSSVAKRMATICFMVKHPRGTFLHNRFVVAVLNDVFGIQATAGAHIGYAMGINEKLAVDYERVLMDDSLELESIRPGYTRISLPYFMSDHEIGFILEALKMVATEAWKLLPQYECDNKTGEWRHHSNSLVKERKWLGAIRYTDGKMLFADRKVSGPGVFPQNYQECLHTARNLFNRARKMAHKSPESDEFAVRLKPSVESLRWYMLPGEAHELLLGHSHNVKNIVPFDPNAAASENVSFIMHRHNSLSALDIKKFMSRSVPLSPVQSHRHQSTPSPVSPVPRPDFCVSPPTLNFSLGGEVTPDLAPICSPKVSSLANGEHHHQPSSLNGPSRSSSINDCPEDIQAYVKEVTQDIATEIKSELREVISKVDNVLESTEALDTSGFNLSAFHQLTSADEMKTSDAVSASDVAQYLREFSIEMASEVKSEIREMCATVKEFNEHPRRCSPTDLDGLKQSLKAVLGSGVGEGVAHRRSDTVISGQKSCELKPSRSESFPAAVSHMWKNSQSAATNGGGGSTMGNGGDSRTQVRHTGAISKLSDSTETASRDSGINMCFGDNDASMLNQSTGIPSRSRIPLMRPDSLSIGSSSETDDTMSSSTSSKASNSQQQQSQPMAAPSSSSSSAVPQAKRQQSDGESSSSAASSDNDTNKWHNLPKEAWKQTAEVKQHYY